MLNAVDLRPGNNFRVFTVTADNTWRQLPALPAIGVLLRTPASNAAAVQISYIQNPTNDQFGSLAADRALSLDISNSGLIWYKAASGGPVLEVWVAMSSAQP